MKKKNYINLVEVREVKTNILEQRMHLPDYQVMSTTRYLRNVSAYPVLFVTHTIMIEKLCLLCIEDSFP